MSDKQKRAQLEESLVDSGFHISKEDLMEMFVTINIHPKIPEGASSADQGPSKSLQLLKKQGFAPEIVKALNSNAVAGIEGNKEDLDMRKRVYGENKHLQRKIRTMCDMICDVLDDFILKVLIVAAIVSTVLGMIKDGPKHGYQEGLGIVFAIIIILVVSVGNDYVKEKQFQELMSQSDQQAIKVIRNGKENMRDTTEIVVGDLILVDNGANIPADCIVVSSNDFACNESALTGEPDALPKEAVNDANFNSQPDCFILQGSISDKGDALAIVCAVGISTNQGQAGLSMNIANDQTPLQKKLDRIANGIGLLGLAVAVMTFIAISISAVVVTFKDENKNFDMEFVTMIANGIVIAITVVVVAVPEGLPLAVTISLAFSVNEMQKLHNLVRKLQSSETMGNANEICTDKTGTLTQNKMTVQSAYIEGAICDGDSRAGLDSLASKDEIINSIILNSTAFIDADEDTGVETTKGNVTEVGLLNYLIKSDAPVKDRIALRGDKTIFKIPFSSVRKRATTAVSLDDGNVRVYCKGAPEMVIKFCTTMVGPNGAKTDLGQDKKDEIITNVVNDFASKTYRTMLVSYADYTAQEWDDLKRSNNDFKKGDDKAVTEKNLCLVAIFALKDPLRDGVPKAVKQCHDAGINVRMVTGDNLNTARAISLEAGILTQEDLNDEEDQEFICMDGTDFKDQISAELKIVEKETEVTDSENEDGEKKTKKVKEVVCEIGNVQKFRRIEKKLKVMSRSQPDHKFMLVDGLIKEGRTVAVTGDGSNDAPALNRSDVGFAMGIAGTDMAKSASDITLLKDNFCDILVAVKYGRNIYDNVRKFLQFQLTVNVVAMFIVFAGACLFSDTPLTSTQMLWVNLIMDTFAALALATEPPTDALLDRKPALKSDAIVNSVMWRNILGQSVFQIIVLLVLLYKGGDMFGIEFDQKDPFYPTEDEIDAHPEHTDWVLQEPTKKVELYTIVFQVFVFMQLFNQINARKLGEKEYNVFASFCNNWMFIAILIVTFAVQMLIVQYGGRYMRAVPLTWEQNGYCALIGAISLIVGLLLKLVPARWFEWIRLEEKEMSPEEEQASMMATLRKSHTMRDSKLSKRGSTRKVRDLDEEGYKAIN